MKNFTWGHGVIVALGCFIAFILFMIFIFPNGQQNSELITDDYYEEELAYQNVIDAKNNADKLTEKRHHNQQNSGDNGEHLLEPSHRKTLSHNAQNTAKQGVCGDAPKLISEVL